LAAGRASSPSRFRPAKSLAFAAFADLEDAFEPIERKVMTLALDVERQIQHEIDVYRGK